MNYNWNWRIFWQASPEGLGTYMDTLLSGLIWTLATAISAWIIALSIGAVIGTIRTMPNRWAVRAANAYVELFRNIPVLVQMFLCISSCLNCCRRRWVITSSRYRARHFLPR